MSFLLDTNVISELRRPNRAYPAVTRWANALETNESYVSVVTIMEIQRGIAMIQPTNGAHADQLLYWLQDEVLPGFGDRILPVDLFVARQCGRFGRIPASHFADALLAATAMIHGLTLATRNVADFLQFGVPLINPWDA